MKTTARQRRCTRPRRSWLAPDTRESTQRPPRSHHPKNSRPARKRKPSPRMDVPSDRPHPPPQTTTHHPIPPPRRRSRKPRCTGFARSAARSPPRWPACGRRNPSSGSSSLRSSGRIGTRRHAARSAARFPPLNPSAQAGATRAKVKRPARPAGRSYRASPTDPAAPPCRSRCSSSPDTCKRARKRSGSPTSTRPGPRPSTPRA